jgi:hypothetical protein
MAETDRPVVRDSLDVQVPPGAAAPQKPPVPFGVPSPVGPS